MAFPTAAKLAHAIVLTRAPAVMRTEMEDGLVKQAQRFSLVLVTRQVRYLFGSLTDYSAFITWFNGAECARGALWFSWPDPADNDTLKLARIVNGQLEEEVPDKQMETWAVSFRLETWE